MYLAHLEPKGIKNNVFIVTLLWTLRVQLCVCLLFFIDAWLCDFVVLCTCVGILPLTVGCYGCCSLDFVAAMQQCLAEATAWSYIQYEHRICACADNNQFSRVCSMYVSFWYDVWIGSLHASVIQANSSFFQLSALHIVQHTDVWHPINHDQHDVSSPTEKHDRWVPRCKDSIPVMGSWHVEYIIHCMVAWVTLQLVNARHPRSPRRVHMYGKK